jgi:anti-sigma factor RsiW
MIPYLGCESTREMLDAFIDGELAVDDQVAVESHLRWCRTCAARVEDMSLIGAAVRLGPPEVRPRPEDAHALASIQAEVLTRIRAERDQSFPVRLREMFSDKRLLWPALGATAAVLVCLSGAFAVMHFATSERPDSLAAMIASAQPIGHVRPTPGPQPGRPGSDENPLGLDDAMLAPRMTSDAVPLDGAPDDESVFAVATVVNRQGRVANYELLLPEQPASHKHKKGTRDDAEDVAALLHAVKQSRFTPAQGESGRPVAVNMVWLFMRTTVVRDAQLEELLNTGTRVRRDRVDRGAAPEIRKTGPGEQSSGDPAVSSSTA